MAGPLLIAVSLHSQRLTLYANGAPIAHSPVSTGTAVTRFPIYVNNQGAVADNFNLTIAGTPAGWTVQYFADGGSGNCSTTTGPALANTGAVAPGAGPSRMNSKKTCGLPMSPGNPPSRAASEPTSSRSRRSGNRPGNRPSRPSVEGH